MVKRGTLLAEVVDYEMKPIREIFAKYDAFIVSLPSYHYVTPSSVTYTLMRIK
jgi:multimeric flavodoxin WrbA